jgi:hypothetical protein
VLLTTVVEHFMTQAPREEERKKERGKERERKKGGERM